MEPYKTFIPSQSLLDQIGAEHAGTYTLHILDAPEYLQTVEQLTVNKRFSAEVQGKIAEPFTEAKLRTAILHRCVTKDGTPYPRSCPVSSMRSLAVSPYR